MGFYRVIFILVCIQCHLVGQSSYFPPKQGEWQRVSAEEAGVNQGRLDAAIDFIQANEYGGSKDLRVAILEGFSAEPFHTLRGPTKKRGGPAGMILYKGKILTSWGETDRVDMTFSCTKSYLSTMAGLAIDRGLIESEQALVGQQVWQGGYFDGHHNSQINWEHLLTQSSDWYGIFYGVDDWSDRPPKDGDINDWARRELHTPGTQYEYNDTRVNLLAYALLEVWRKPLPMVLKEEIMDPIGASSTWRWYGYDDTWATIDGQMMQTVSGGGHHGGGLFISTEDHARFGLLFANEGKWQDQQLLSPQWIAKARKPHVSNPNYGYMWWLNTPDTNRYFPEAPPTMYYAAGFGGNYVVIDPDHDLVIVLRWLEPNQFEEALAKIYAAFNK